MTAVTKATPFPLDIPKEFEDAGFEGADSDAYAIPFLRILQSNSPQVNEDEESYIDGAKPGMFFNTVSRKVYGKEVKVIPIRYKRDFVEWRPDRGGFAGNHGADPSLLEECTRNERNQDVLPNGNVLQDTRNHFVMIADSIEDGPMVFSLTSTGIRHSKNWMSSMVALRLENGKKPPMFYSIWELRTVINENDEGKWYQVGSKSMTGIKWMSWLETEAQYNAAKAAFELTESKIEVAYDKGEKGDIPF
jgi:hypothetical protein